MPQRARPWLGQLLPGLLIALSGALAGCPEACSTLPATECSSNLQCPVDFVCDTVMRYCVRPDAGSSDGPAKDSAAHDDAAVGDAAVGDAAVGDAAVGDAAVGDAAVGDAAVGDAAVGDAATADEGHADGAAVDAGSGDAGAADGPIGLDSRSWDRSTEGYNIVFISSTWHRPVDLQGVAAADAQCQALAGGAGLVGTFVAWMSSSNSSARSRLGAAHGFVQRDGLPFADTLDDIAAKRIVYPLRLDQNGASDGFLTYVALTGTDVTGAAASTCSSWSNFGNSGTYTGGFLRGGGALWTAGTYVNCDSGGHLYCFETDHQRQLGSFARQGRLAFVSSTNFFPGGGLAAADALCRYEASGAATAGSFVALLPGVGASAAARLSAARGPWVRHDGALIAWSGEEMLAGNWLAPIDMTATGSPGIAGNVWTGGSAPDAIGTSATTCNGWTDSSSAGSGATGMLGERFSSSFWHAAQSCSTGAHIYCVQQ